MAQVMVHLNRVQVFENENGSNVNLVFNEKIEGFEKKVDDRGNIDFVAGDVGYVSINRSALTAQLCSINEDIDAYRGTLDHAFGQKEFGLILQKAVLTLDRELHTAGEVYGTDDDGTELAYSRDCYTTTVVGVKLSEKAQARLDKALDL